MFYPCNKNKNNNNNNPPTKIYWKDLKYRSEIWHRGSTHKNKIRWQLSSRYLSMQLLSLRQLYLSLNCYKILDVVILSKKKIKVPKFFLVKIKFWVSKNWVQKKFCVKKKFGQTKFWVKKTLEPTKFWVKKDFGSKKIWVQKS